jgi:hypothetical protein
LYVYDTDQRKKVKVEIEGIGSQYILILQRGVDPYSPLYNNEYRLGTLFGVAEDDEKFTFTAATRLNIPIQKIMSPSKMQDYIKVVCITNHISLNRVLMEMSHQDMNLRDIQLLTLRIMGY